MLNSGASITVIRTWVELAGKSLEDGQSIPLSQNPCNNGTSTGSPNATVANVSKNGELLILIFFYVVLPLPGERRVPELPNS